MKVLLVDDEVEFVSTLSERLALRGIDADWVSSADEALERAEQCRYDIAVLDIKMPGTGGIELKKVLDERSPGMKYVFLTGHGSEADFEIGASETGSEYYLVKPVRIEKLVEKILSAGGRSRRQEDE